ncbi:urease accessory protein UreD [Neptuniibacter halophilus]|uniref:urease accessory protein UreD n=1 Tax=Neptuniibacter halophilus TaxID=651666 RepID=UPI0025733EAB|nr:urease accessory protein UreD [Neptuniibacter halophilus]
MNQIVSQATLPGASSWQAELTLGLSRTARGTVLKRSEHRGPLYVQKPFYPEGRELAHLYLLHPPGGMVSGDDLQIRVNTDSDAHALITTPGAGRVYRARPDRSLQKQCIQLQVAENSSLEWLPLENIIFPDANTELQMQIDLAENSQLIAWDITCFGLPASQQPFDRGEVRQSLQLFQGGRLKLREKLNLNPQHNSLMQSRAGLAGQAVNGLMLAGPFFSEECVTELIASLREACASESALAAVSLNGEFLQIRYLGACSEQARLLFTRCWKLIRPQLLQRDGCEPRIWAT